MRLAVPWLLIRRRWAVAVVLVAGAAGAVAAGLAVAPAAGSIRPRSIDAAGADVRSARPSVQRASAFAPLEEHGPKVQVRVLVQDLHAQPITGAVVEVWADGRGCVDRSEGNQQSMRGDVVDPPPGMVVWRSAADVTGRDGVAQLQVPVGMMTHVVAFDRSGRRAVLRVADHEMWDGNCMEPCGGVGGCGTCTGLPCTWPRHAGACGRDIHDAVLRLATPAHVTGRVIDERGRPVAGARIGTLTETLAFDTDEYAYDEQQARDSLVELPYASPPDDWSRVPHATPVVTGADGRFAIDLVEWRRFAVAATAPGRRLGVSAPLQLRPGSQVDVTVTLHRSSRIDIRVVDASGRPIAGARAGLQEDDLFDDLPARADRRGRILFDGLRPEAQSVSVDAEGYEPFHATLRPSWRPVTVRLAPAAHVSVDVSAPPAFHEPLGDRPLIEVRLLRTGESLAGDEWRAPERTPEEHRRYQAMSVAEKAEFEKAEIARALDRLLEERDRRIGAPVELGPDGRGRVAIERLPPGRYTVCVADPTRGSCGPTVQIRKRGAASVRLRLAGDGTITGADQTRCGGAVSP